MEQANFQEQFNRLISEYLDNPADLSGIDPAQVTTLIEKYPFCQPLYLIRAALKQDDQFAADLAAAAVYSTNRDSLYRAIHEPGKLPKLPNTGEWKMAAAPPAATAGNGTEDLVPENIAASDFFAFERTQSTPLIGSKDDNKSSSPLPPASEPGENNARGVAKYDDDQLPYTFLWWLNKTRKEHAQTYRPYAPTILQPPLPEEKKNSENELNSQIMENIFHLKSQIEPAAEPENTRTVPFQVKNKEDRIIERFIREDPMIKPLQAEKIDNENKARKSSEDPNDLVSETLARIYADQMLYQKAADTYRKLRLKFPEKSAYFADQISDLERKV